ncbi:MAG: glycosyltransferase family 39 protein [Patescibacteria group bacterium]
MKNNIVILLVILLFIFITRFIGNNYDHGLHLHPDERWLMMLNDKLSFPDQLDPDFFAYGSLPSYTLKAVLQTSDSLLGTDIDNYDSALVVGRIIASLLDIGVGWLVFVTARKISKNQQVAILATLFYSLSFFPIQNSNFFVVDNFVNFLTSLTIYLTLLYFEKPNIKQLILLAISYAALISCKITPIIFLPLIMMLIFKRSLLTNTQPNSSFLKLTMVKIKNTIMGLEPRKTKITKYQLLFQAFLKISLFFITGLTFAYMFMPYAFIKHQQFLREVINQIKMNSNAYIFPYTLQYIGTTPYIYYLKNIFLWGVGPIIGLLAIGGLFVVLTRQYQIIFQAPKTKFSLSLVLNHELIYFSFFLIYFLVIGRSAVKFMRYMLPLYPFLAYLSAQGLSSLIKQKWLSPRLSKILVVVTLGFASLWTMAFLNIYTRPHTRVEATDWMLTNIPPGSVISQEHWDDGLPLRGGDRFQSVEFPLYEQPDDQKKWLTMNQKIDQVEYIILSSNRLSAPLRKLNDCTLYQACYPLTAKYYRDLFAGRLGFEKVAEFTSRPNIFGLEINDDNADESFTVYDHPQVLIFKKINGLNL